MNSSTLLGKALSPGLGRGRTFIYRDDLSRFDEFYDIEAAQVEAERRRFGIAVTEISGDLDDLAGQVRREVDADLSDVFRAHIVMLEDASLRAEVHREIGEELVSAGSAVRAVFRQWERRFRSMEAEVARQKADDMRELQRRLVLSLAGVRANVLENMPHGNVLVASRLLPSDTIFLSRRRAAAAILEVGGIASHAALFAHELGLPCIAGIPGVVGAVPQGDLALVDAGVGEAIINPDKSEERAFEAKCKRRQQAEARARVHTQESAVTRNGKVIPVLANVGTLEDTQEAVRNGADGIGLYRIERVYLGRQKPPDATALFEEIRSTLGPARGLPVYVRLLDVGADKPLPFMEEHRESNPALGCRGVRFLLAYRELLQTQLAALLQLSSDFDLHVLVPMVTLPSDMRLVKDLLIDYASRRNFRSMPKLGAMIETPAAALSASDIVSFADFLSVGTNDLTQYTFAADRENSSVESYYDDSHQVIFRLLRTIHTDVPNVSLSVCGELATRTKVISEILDCGVTSLSVPPPSIPSVKQAVRKCGDRT